MLAALGVVKDTVKYRYGLSSLLTGQIIIYNQTLSERSFKLAVTSYIVFALKIICH